MTPTLPFTSQQNVEDFIDRPSHLSHFSVSACSFGLAFYRSYLSFPVLMTYFLMASKYLINDAFRYHFAVLNNMTLWDGAREEPFDIFKRNSRVKAYVPIFSNVVMYFPVTLFVKSAKPCATLHE